MRGASAAARDMPARSKRAANLGRGGAWQSSLAWRPRRTSSIEYLGGGLVAGSAVLISGSPGAGKSTLLIQILCELAKTQSCLYVTGEESLAQIAMRANRLRLQTDRLKDHVPNQRRGHWLRFGIRSASQRAGDRLDSGDAKRRDRIGSGVA